MRINPKYAGLAFCFLLWPGSAAATEIVYVPVNPSFGGNPLNGPLLLGSAQATNKHRDDSGLGGSSPLNQSPLQQFNDTLARSILSQLASAATSRLIGADGKLIPGTLQTANFTISIADTGNGSLRITTTDKITGATTSFEVGK
jgi:curli production assembly/transport component CsgF